MSAHVYQRSTKKRQSLFGPILLRNDSPFLGLSDHFPVCGILNYRLYRDWSLRVCYFGGAL